MKNRIFFQLFVLFACCPITNVLLAQTIPDRFQLVADGTYDTVTELTWGFDLGYADEWMGFVYGGRSWDNANTLLLYSLQPDENGDSQLVRVPYSEFSWLYSGELHEDWRLPTQEELSAAEAAGMFGFHSLVPGDPTANIFALGGSGFKWSSTSAGKGKGGYTSYATVNLRTGEVSKANSISSLSAIVVRGGITDPDSGGGGKGNGKGKKK